MKDETVAGAHWSFWVIGAVVAAFLIWYLRLAMRKCWISWFCKLTVEEREEYAACEAVLEYSNEQNSSG